MVAQQSPPPHPRRFMAAQRRNRRLGRPLQIPLFAKNVIRYQMMSRTGAGRACLQRWGERCSDNLLVKYFGEQIHDVGELTV